MPALVKILIFAFGLVVAIFGFIQLIGESRRGARHTEDDANAHSVQFLGLELRVSSTPALLVLAGITAMVVPWVLANSDEQSAPVTAAGLPALESTEAPATGSTATVIDGSTSKQQTIIIEAEDGSLIPPMAAISRTGALGGAVVSSPERDGGVLRVDFDVKVAGDYRVWAHVSTGEPDVPATDSNSFTVSLDNKGIDVWDIFEDTAAPPSGLKWELVSMRCGGSEAEHLCDPWILRLEPGSHSLAIAAREPNAVIDQLIITSDPDFAP